MQRCKGRPFSHLQPEGHNSFKQSTTGHFSRSTYTAGYLPCAQWRQPTSQHSVFTVSQTLPIRSCLVLQHLKAAQVDGVGRGIPDQRHRQPLEGALDAVDSKGLPYTAQQTGEGSCRGTAAADPMSTRDVCLRLGHGAGIDLDTACLAVRSWQWCTVARY